MYNYSIIHKRKVQRYHNAYQSNNIVREKLIEFRCKIISEYAPNFKPEFDIYYSDKQFFTNIPKLYFEVVGTDVDILEKMNV